MEMQEDIAIKYICAYLIGTLKRFNFNTKVRRYYEGTPENILLESIEDAKFFRDRSGYIVMAGIDGMEYISGNQNSLASSWNGSRPNINYTELNIPDIKKSQEKTLETLRKGGGYMRYPWINPNVLIFQYQMHNSYVQMYDSYLYLNITYSIGNAPKEDASIPVVMTDVIQQIISNFWLYSQDSPVNYDNKLLTAINDGHVTLIDATGKLVFGILPQSLVNKAIQVVNQSGGGFVTATTFCTQIPYFDSIICYSL